MCAQKEEKASSRAHGQQECKNGRQGGMLEFNGAHHQIIFPKTDGKGRDPSKLPGSPGSFQGDESMEVIGLARRKAKLHLAEE